MALVPASADNAPNDKGRNAAERPGDDASREHVGVYLYLVDDPPFVLFDHEPQRFKSEWRVRDSNGGLLCRQLAEQRGPSCA